MAFFWIKSAATSLSISKSSCSYKAFPKNYPVPPRVNRSMFRCAKLRSPIAIVGTLGLRRVTPVWPLQGTYWIVSVPWPVYARVRLGLLLIGLVVGRACLRDRPTSSSPDLYPVVAGPCESRVLHVTPTYPCQSTPGHDKPSTDHERPRCNFSAMIALFLVFKSLCILSQLCILSFSFPFLSFLCTWPGVCACACSVCVHACVRTCVCTSAHVQACLNLNFQV